MFVKFSPRTFYSGLKTRAKTTEKEVCQLNQGAVHIEIENGYLHRKLGIHMDRMQVGWTW